jgi:D-methionine transport system substrate-binding protein
MFKMKKVFTLYTVLLLVFVMTACSTNENKLVIGASNIPHAEILEQVKPILAEQGIELEIVTFQGYVLPNKALHGKDIDANYFQHIPYLQSQIADHGYDFVNAGGVHIEPIGVYSKKYKSIEELPHGATIIMSNSVADHGRILTLLQNNGLITLASDVETTKATIEDIINNPKKLNFIANVDAGLLPQLYNNNEGDAVLINTNYAIDAGLNPLEDAILIEGADSPYVNVIAVRSGDENREDIQALLEVLRSKEIQDFIKKEYKGAVVPVK